MPITIKTIPYHPKELEKLFIYNPDNGKLYNRIDRNPAAMRGAEAGGVDDTGRRKVQLERVKYPVHRIVWKMVRGKDPVGEIDHIDHDPLNNRMENLREVDHLENHKNKSKDKTNTSGVTGVHWHKKNQKWQVNITVEGKRIHLGYFPQRGHAIRARKLAEAGYGFHKNHGAAA